MEKENQPNVDDSDSTIPDNILEKYRAALNDTLPAKSAKKYAVAYYNFCEWQKKNGTDSIDEIVLMAYMQDLSEKYAPSTLWSVYSMLKRMIINIRNFNISGYSQLINFLKNKAAGYEGKKSNVFTPEEIHTFMTTAPDDQYLALKVNEREIIIESEGFYRNLVNFFRLSWFLG